MVLQHLWEEAESVTKESDIRARLIGVGSQMTYFGVYLGEMVLRHTDNLSKTKSYQQQRGNKCLT